MTDDCFHPESLEEFSSQLAAEGFEPVVPSDVVRWRGPVHPAFSSLSEATTMDIVIRAGWPFQPPVLLVEGLETNHSTLGGYVCMWRDGDPSLEWTTFTGFSSRIEAWCEEARNGWPGDDLGYDAFLNFQETLGNVATFDLPKLGIRIGRWGECHGVVNLDPLRVDVKPGRQKQAEQLRGLWFHAGTFDSPPPRRPSEVYRYLSGRQRKALQRALHGRRRPEKFSASGGLDLLLFCWERNGRTDLLIMICEGIGDEVKAVALQPGPIDEASLILRAGPDAPTLRNMRVTIFGAGALGGYAATALAESGVGFIDLVDPDVILPGNVVRHVAARDQVGMAKVRAVRQVVQSHAPWTTVTEFQEAPFSPGKIRERISSADLVVNCTGNDAFTDALAMFALELGKPLVSGALYRGGCISRVQRQALPTDTPVHQRDDTSRYPVIPEGDAQDDFATPALGCSAPINNAPPASVMACSSRIVQVALDSLTGRLEFEDEVIDVYRALPCAPFERVGNLPGI